jgi:hypothetical protein
MTISTATAPRWIGCGRRGRAVMHGSVACRVARVVDTQPGYRTVKSIAMPWPTWPGRLQMIA